MHFDHNAISGNISASIGDLDQLSSLVAGNNELSGICEELFLIETISRVELQGNRLSGAVPATIGSAAALRTLLLFDNQNLSGAIQIDV